jgi:hypothetical protein
MIGIEELVFRVWHLREAVLKFREYMNCELIQALLPETPFHEFSGTFADGPEFLPFRDPAPPPTWGPESAFLPEIAFRGIRGKSSENAISRFGLLF